MPHKIIGVGPALDPVPLIPGEQVIFSVHPSLVPLFFLLILVLGAGAAISFFFFTTNIATDLGLSQFATIVTFAPIVVASLVAFIIFLNWLNTIYILTDLRVQWEFGILGERVRSIDNSDIQAVQTDQGLVGRIFNYGDVSIRSAQQPIPIDFTQIGSPNERAQQIIAEQP